MYAKCPNIITTNDSHIVETIYNTQYKTKIIKNPDLDIKIEQGKEEKDQCFFVTNYFQIKCPICLSFKENVLIQQCGHCLCKECLNLYISNNEFGKTFQCFFCRQISYEYSNNKKDNTLLFKFR